MTCPVCRHTVTGIDVIHRHRDGIGQMCPASGAPIRITNHEGGLATRFTTSLPIPVKSISKT